MIHTYVANVAREKKNYGSKPHSYGSYEFGTLVWLIWVSHILTNVFFVCLFDTGIAHPFGSYKWCCPVWVKFRCMVSLYFGYYIRISLCTMCMVNLLIYHTCKTMEPYVFGILELVLSKWVFPDIWGANKAEIRVGLHLTLRFDLRVSCFISPSLS